MPTTQKIRYSDCDPQGIVFNGNYARYWDDALTDWFEELGFDPPGLGETGVEMLTARIEMDLKASAGLKDVLETRVTLEGIGNTSMTLGFVTVRLSDGATVVVGREVIVIVDEVEFRPVPVPEVIRVAAQRARPTDGPA